MNINMKRFVNNLFLVIVLGAILLCLVACNHKISAPAEPFDKQQAWSYLKYQVELGKRIPGSDVSRKLAEDIKNRLTTYGFTVTFQDFTAHTPQGPIPMRNIIATLPGEKANSFVLGAHYDTKIFTDFDFVGANDGASGVAVLMEIARWLPQLKLHHSVILVFFDGEEAIEQWGPDDSLYGSRYYVNSLVESNSTKTIDSAFIVDMVGNKDLVITDESFSTPELKEAVRQAAEELDLDEYFPASRRMAIEDDHIPFLENKIPTIDIIGFYSTISGLYPSTWHTSNDTLENVSPDSLQVVGAVLMRTLRNLDSM